MFFGFAIRLINNLLRQKSVINTYLTLMNYFVKMLGDENRRFLLLKIAVVLFAAVVFLSSALGRFDIAGGSIAAAYAVLGYRKYKKYSKNKLAMKAEQ